VVHSIYSQIPTVVYLIVEFVSTVDRNRLDVLVFPQRAENAVEYAYYLYIIAGRCFVDDFRCEANPPNQLELPSASHGQGLRTQGLSALSST
jgi:hypothetical protein